MVDPAVDDSGERIGELRVALPGRAVDQIEVHMVEACLPGPPHHVHRPAGGVRAIQDLQHPA